MSSWDRAWTKVRWVVLALLGGMLATAGLLNHSSGLALVGGALVVVGVYRLLVEIGSATD